ncbi:MAG: hypothetical protein LBS96_04420 [Oscillospiraceae bacterium]|jgi:formate C-acetyltransferase|nr:hypothetical protein [Oscillospiraceae bacterium]
MDYPYDQSRIESLRQEAFSAPKDYTAFSYYFHKGLQAKNNTEYTIATGEAVYYMYDRAPVYIAPEELLAGRCPVAPPLTAEEEREWQLIRKHALSAMPNGYGQTSHMTIDCERLLTLGAEGVMEEIRRLRSTLDLTLPEDWEKEAFYRSCIRALEGLCRYAERYADEAVRQAAGADPVRKAELLQMAQNLRNTPRKPAGSFYEAIQCVHFVTFALSAKPFFGPGSHLYQLGRPDRYLWPYYEKDLRGGRITQAFAQTLLDCFGVLLNTRIPGGLAAGYMVGGRDGKTGKVISNDLTRMIIRSVSHIRMIYPGVGLCWCSATPEEDLRLACEVLGEGHSHPAIFNDDVIARGLRFHGVPAEDAHDYIHSTCVEITPIGTSNVWVASPYMNLVQKLLDVIGRSDYAAMGDLLAAYTAHVADGIRSNLECEIRNRAQRSRHFRDPLLSCFVRDCLENGKDIEAGGARYNWIMPSFVGLSNVADALAAIERLVFPGEISWTELREALAANFEGQEDLRQRILNLPKYGNDDAAADQYVLLLTEMLTRAVEPYQKRPENHLVPSLFCWVMHDNFGRETGASPDGRRAGFPLGDGSGPAQGREIKGPTAAVLSSTKWEHYKFIGGIAVNMKFSKKMFRGDSLGNLLAVVKTYLERGGFELQINVVDRETLRKAQANPDAYRDVVVRIGGYSDYFTRLSPTMQAEVLARTEYEI